MKKVKLIAVAASAAVLLSGMTAISASAAGFAPRIQLLCNDSCDTPNSFYQGTWKEQLDRLVAKGAISAYQEGAILKGLTAQSGDWRYALHTVLEKLVAAGTMDRGDLAEVESALLGVQTPVQTPDTNFWSQGSATWGSSNWSTWTAQLDKLQSAGVINAYQESAILKGLSTQSGDWRYALHTVLVNLVTSGTIDLGDQAEVEKALLGGWYSNPGYNWNAWGQGPWNQYGAGWSAWKTQLDKLQSSGAISAYQEQAILKGLTGQSGDWRTVLHTVLTNLLSAGTIDQGDLAEVETALLGLPYTGQTPYSWYQEHYNQNDYMWYTYQQELDRMVAMDMITGWQEDAILKGLQTQTGDWQQALRTVLENLVWAGTITQDTKAAIERNFGI